MSLSKKECVPCKGGVPPLKGEELEKLKEQVDGWDVVEVFCLPSCDNVDPIRCRDGIAFGGPVHVRRFDEGVGDEHGRCQEGAETGAECAQHPG